MSALQNYSDKAQEIAYALIRLAAYVRRKDFRLRLENLALTLVESASVAEPHTVLGTSASIQNVVKLLTSVYEMETVNARVLLDELARFDSAIRQSFGIDTVTDVNALFSSSGSINSVQEIRKNPIAGLPHSLESAIDVADGIKETMVDIDESVDSSLTQDKQQSNIISVGSAIRQSAILDKIKIACNDVSGSGSVKGCRMKDLIAEFPDVSERTLRYDLQRLLQHGSIERVGNGGPASYYVIKNK